MVNAVISANHEALAQILDQTSQKHPLIGKTANLRMEEDLTLSDFEILEEAESVTIRHLLWEPTT